MRVCLAKCRECYTIRFQVVRPMHEDIERGFCVITGGERNGDIRALAVQTKHPQQRGLAYAANAVNDEQSLRQCWRGDGVLERSTQGLNVGKEFGKFFVLSRLMEMTFRFSSVLSTTGQRISRLRQIDIHAQHIRWQLRLDALAHALQFSPPSTRDGVLQYICGQYRPFGTNSGEGNAMCGYVRSE